MILDFVFINKFMKTTGTHGHEVKIFINQQKIRSDYVNFIPKKLSLITYYMVSRFFSDVIGPPGRWATFL